MTSSKETKRLAVKVTPNAGRSEIIGFKEGVLQIKIGAPPDKGKANKELVDFLSEKLGVKKSAILILQGQAGRNKVIEVTGMSVREIQKKLDK